MLFCFLRLNWVFIKSECLDVGSGKYLSAVNQPAIILIFKNIAFFRNCLLCLFWASFWLRDFGLFFLIVWFDWLFRLVVFYWTVVILCGRRKIMVGRCIAMLPLLNSMSKWVRADSNGWFLIWTCIVCCENAFVFWTSLCERHKLNRLPNSDGYCSCVEENAAGCLALF